MHKILSYLAILPILLIVFAFVSNHAFAVDGQRYIAQASINNFETIDGEIVATDEAEATPSAKEKDEKSKEDVTKPEDEQEKKDVLELFSQRPANSPTVTNFMAYSVQFAVKSGVPANTIILVLLLPLLATIVAFFRHIIGLPSLDMLVPIALSITLLATGVTSGMILLVTILFASTFARILFKRIRIMHLPKMALSLIVVSIFVFVTLTLGASTGLLDVEQLSIFPVLLLILLSERIIALQLDRTTGETIKITVVTIALGIGGFVLLSSAIVREYVLLYPEIILLLIPINIIIGRYFGLRLTEYFRFKSILQNGNK